MNALLKKAGIKDNNDDVSRTDSDETVDEGTQVCTVS